MSQFRMTTSTTYIASKSNFNFATLQQVCGKMSIKLTKFSDSQLESAYVMQGFKASGIKANQVCYIFVSLIDDSKLDVSSYFNGTLVNRKDLNGEAKVAEFIKESLKIVSDNFPNTYKIEQEYKKLERLFDELEKASQQILNKSQNQMMAIQDIKTSPQYAAICNHSLRLSKEVQTLCHAAKNRQSQSRIKNESLIDQMLSVQQDKQILQLSLFRYSQIVKQISDIDRILDKAIQNKKDQGDAKDFFDEASFNRYIAHATEIKVLENLKKYIDRT